MKAAAPKTIESTVAPADSFTNDSDEDLEVRLFLEAVYAKYGYDFRCYSMDSIRRRLFSALTKFGFKHLGELQHEILKNPSLFMNILEMLTIRVTEFFRDPFFYERFRARVIPVLKTYPILKFWHCGCSTGEEAYTSAILLAEEGLLDRAQIYATDVHPGSLEQAAEGIYPTSVLESLKNNYVKSGGRGNILDYITVAYDRFALAESFRRRILFFPHNLATDYSFGQMNVIFCRNVLIYFSKELRALVLKKMSDSTYPGSFLCVGTSERVLESDSALKVEKFDEIARIYQVRGIQTA